MALLDCRDTLISLWQDGNAIYSPGFVLLDGSEYRFGQAALEQSRLRPRDSNSRFWWQLSTQPLKPSLGAARHTADLVHSHLRHIHEAGGEPDSLVLAVPESMPPEQLSLLLGVAQACTFTVTGLVSRSVLIASSSPIFASHARALHLEAQLNQTIINELVLDDGTVRVVRSTPLPACGLLSLQERCASAIASAFIQQTRFDPRRSASSEQALYNMLPNILDTLRSRGEASVDIDGHRCRVTASALAGASERLLAGLAQARPNDVLPLLLDPELLQLPGMESIGGDVHTLADNALWEAFSRQREGIVSTGAEVHLINRLSPLKAAAGKPAQSTQETIAAPAQNAAPSVAPAASGAAGATHVLIGTRALPLRGERVELGGGFSLRHQQAHWTLHGDGGLINGLPSTAQQPLSLGDTLSLGSAGHGRLIEVLD